MRQTQRGVGLIENLVAMLVLLLGMLGVAGLMVHVLRQAGRAEYETRAAYAAQMMLSAAFAQASGNLAALQALDNRTTAKPGGGQGAMQQALDEWSACTRQTLPAGAGALRVTAPGGGACAALPCVLTVTMSWTGSNRLQADYVTSQVMGY